MLNSEEASIPAGGGPKVENGGADRKECSGSFRDRWTLQVELSWPKQDLPYDFGSSGVKDLAFLRFHELVGSGEVGWGRERRGHLDREVDQITHTDNATEEQVAGFDCGTVNLADGRVLVGSALSGC